MKIKHIWVATTELLSLSKPLIIAGCFQVTYRNRFLEGATCRAGHTDVGTYRHPPEETTNRKSWETNETRWATKKTLNYFPWNPGWLIGILISWFMIIPIYLGSIIPYITQPTRFFFMAQVNFHQEPSVFFGWSWWKNVGKKIETDHTTSGRHDNKNHYSFRSRKMRVGRTLAIFGDGFSLTYKPYIQPI